MRSVLIDTNALVLYIAGSLDPTKLGQHRRLRSFDAHDLKRLQEIIDEHPRHVSLPNVLSEASNLIGSGSQEIVRGAAEALAAYCRLVDEIYRESALVVEEPAYLRLGITDAAILRVLEPNLTVVTTDHMLYGMLSELKVNAINLMHFKTPSGID